MLARQIFLAGKDQFLRLANDAFDLAHAISRLLLEFLGVKSGRQDMIDVVRECHPVIHQVERLPIYYFNGGYVRPFLDGLRIQRQPQSSVPFRYERRIMEHSELASLLQQDITFAISKLVPLLEIGAFSGIQFRKLPLDDLADFARLRPVGELKKAVHQTDRVINHSTILALMIARHEIDLATFRDLRFGGDKRRLSADQLKGGKVRGMRNRRVGHIVITIHRHFRASEFSLGCRPCDHKEPGCAIITFVKKISR